MSCLRIINDYKSGCVKIYAYRKGRVKPGAFVEVCEEKNTIRIKSSRILIGKVFYLDKITDIRGYVKVVTSKNSHIKGVVNVEFSDKYKLQLLEAIEPIINDGNIQMMNDEIMEIVKFIKLKSNL